MANPDGSGGAVRSETSQDQLPVVPGSAKYDDKLARSLHGDTVSAWWPVRRPQRGLQTSDHPYFALACGDSCAGQQILAKQTCRCRLPNGEPSPSCSSSVLLVMCAAVSGSAECGT